jgi:hypothetical protein
VQKARRGRGARCQYVLARARARHAHACVCEYVLARVHACLLAGMCKEHSVSRERKSQKKESTSPAKKMDWLCKKRGAVEAHAASTFSRTRVLVMRSMRVRVCVKCFQADENQSDGRQIGPRCILSLHMPNRLPSEPAPAPARQNGVVCARACVFMRARACASTVYACAHPCACGRDKIKKTT